MNAQMASSEDMALSMQSVSKTFTTRPVLKDISLSLHRGQAACLCGINGAGKSTLLRIAAGLLRPDTGAVSIEGRDVREHPEESRRRLGMISHVGMVYGELTVRENLCFAADLYGVPDRAGRIERVLADTGLAPFRHDRAAILSRGLLQRLAIARALLHGPTILLADEPFTGLDRETSERLIEISLTFVQRGGTILMTTHDTRMGLRCCERVIVLDAGVCLLDKPKDEIDPDGFADDYLSYARSES